MVLLVCGEDLPKVEMSWRVTSLRGVKIALEKNPVTSKSPIEKKKISQLVNTRVRVVYEW